jgi:hypothetical protein
MQIEARDKKTVIITFRATEREAQLIKLNRQYSKLIREAVLNNLPNFGSLAER